MASNASFPVGTMNTTSSNTVRVGVGGVPNNTATGESTGGVLDDAGIWNGALSAVDVAALCNAPTTFTAAAAAGHYGQANMQTLFNLYSAESGSATIGTDVELLIGTAGLHRASPGSAGPTPRAARMTSTRRHGPRRDGVGSSGSRILDTALGSRRACGPVGLRWRKRK